MNTARAIIVEDDQEFQISLSDALDQAPGDWYTHIYGVGRDALSFLEAFDGQMDLALIDLGLPDMDGTKIIAKLRASFPKVPILVVSVITCHRKIKDAMLAGATGYILKDDDIFDIASSIGLVMKGHSPISTAVAQELIQLVPRSSVQIADTELFLSHRETELLAYICEGLSRHSPSGLPSDVKIA